MKQKNKTIIKIIVIIMGIVLSILIFNYLKHKRIDAGRDYEKDYYAVIEDISENNGVCIKRRKSYYKYGTRLAYFCIDEDTKIVYKDKKIEVSDLKIGQKILIDHSGWSTIGKNMLKKDNVYIC